MMNFDNQDLTEPLKWDCTHWYGMIGAAYSNRFQKNFEIGGELLAGISQAVFKDLLPDVGTCRVIKPYIGSRSKNKP